LAFEKLVEAALAQVPAAYRRRMTNVAIVVEEEPPSGDLLGLFEGRPYGQDAGFAMPDKITIFRGPHLRMARDGEHLRRIVSETLWHEIGHYFGMNERQVEAAQRRRSRVMGRVTRWR
jgi:predicted Zn-dependent protease with MMP-like domain